MRGVGESTAAITVVNALSTGIGCAVGIDLRARAEVVVTPETAGPVLEIGPPTSRTPLVEASLSAAVEEYLPDRHVRARLEIRSEIPVAIGLKSSSAVSTATLLAVARAAEVPAPVAEVARRSAEIARRVGASATGAFDDALAGLTHEMVVTNNYTDELIRDVAVEPGLEVALWIPPGAHRPSPSVRHRFSADDPLGAQAAEAALRGEWWTAMGLNSELVERAMGYAYAPYREAVAREGARGSGASGLGPAFAAVAPRERIDAVLACLPPSAGARRAIRFASANRSSEGRGP